MVMGKGGRVSQVEERTCPKAERQGWASMPWLLGTIHFDRAPEDEAEEPGEISL